MERKRSQPKPARLPLMLWRRAMPMHAAIYPSCNAGHLHKSMSSECAWPTAFRIEYHKACDKAGLHRRRGFQAIRQQSVSLYEHGFGGQGRALILSCMQGRTRIYQPIPVRPHWQSVWYVTASGKVVVCKGANGFLRENLKLSRSTTQLLSMHASLRAVHACPAGMRERTCAPTR